MAVLRVGVVTTLRDAPCRAVVSCTVYAFQRSSSQLADGVPLLGLVERVPLSNSVGEPGGVEAGSCAWLRAVHVAVDHEHQRLHLWQWCEQLFGRVGGARFHICGAVPVARGLEHPVQ
jgi:hypothetical protein